MPMMICIKSKNVKSSKKLLQTAVKKNSCTKDINLLRILTNKKWGADTKALLHIYQSLIPCKIDYGLIAFSTANRKILKNVTVIQNTALRIAFGAHKTTPTESVYCLSNKLSLCLRKKLLLSNYINLLVNK